MTLIAFLQPANYPPCVSCSHSLDVYGNPYTGGPGATCALLFNPVEGVREFCTELRRIDAPTNRCGLTGAFYVDRNANTS